MKNQVTGSGRKVVFHHRRFLNPMGFSASSYVNAFIGESEYKDRSGAGFFTFASLEIASCDSAIKFLARTDTPEKTKKFIKKMESVLSLLESEEEVAKAGDVVVVHDRGDSIKISDDHTIVMLHSFSADDTSGVDEKLSAVIELFKEFIAALKGM